jgi:hypothetical protein
VILVYAGWRAQALADDPELVGKRVRRLLAGLQPGTVVGAAADGGDLLLPEAVLEIPGGPAAHVVLPTPRDVFRETPLTQSGAIDSTWCSKRSRGGAAWWSRSILKRVRRHIAAATR